MRSSSSTVTIGSWRWSRFDGANHPCCDKNPQHVTSGASKGGPLEGRLLHANVSRLVLIPILPPTFLFGPAGFLLFQAVRFVYQGERS
jgi:hypothetical protein